MKTLILKNIAKYYEISKSKKFYALKDINLSFENNGLHAIIGKSGSGKSTLLNLIAHLDNPSRGQLFLNGKKYPKKKLYSFFQNEVSVVFQDYHLLENETVLFNVTLPLFIKQINKKVAINKAKEILRFVNINEELFYQKCSTLSGGEKQRVAIARAIIKDPKILLCDEPTGALDNSNSIIVMELLKKISKYRLVIVISHNLQLVDNYSDRIIELSDGKIVNDYYKKQIKEILLKEVKNKKSLSTWSNKLSLSNFKNRFKRHLFVIAGLSLTLLMANIVAGFLNGKDTAIRNSCYRQLDFGSGSVSKEELVSNSGMLKLVKSVRPDFNALIKDPYISTIFEICCNFSSILPQNINILYDEESIDDLSFLPIYSFDEKHINRSLLLKGNFPEEDSLDEVIINKYAYKKIKKIIKKDPIGECLNLSHYIETNYVSEFNDIITDTFEFNITAKIVGVVDELSYLSSEKIYYSYLGLESLTQEYVLNNLSTYYDNKITWYDRIATADNYSYISSYSYLLFLKDYRYRNYLFDVEIFKDDLSFSSNSFIISNSLMGFMDVAKYGLILFIVISSIGAVLITSIISFTNYSEDRKKSAVLSSIGARDSEIKDIYIMESLYSGFISIIISFLLAIPLSNLINKIVFNKLSVNNLINIPFLNFLNIPFLYPLIFIIVIIFIICVFTVIPISFSKKNSIKEELKNND